MQKACVILSLIVILGCVSADYKTIGSWSVAPKKVFNSDNANDAIYFASGAGIQSQVQGDKSVKVFVFGVNTTDQKNMYLTERNLSVPAFAAPAGNDTKLTISTPPAVTGDSNSIVMVNTTSDNKIVASYMNLNNGAPIQIATVDSTLKQGLNVEATSNQNGTIVVLYSDSGVNLYYAMLAAGKQSTASLVANYTKGSAECIPHNDGKNVYCYFKTTKDKTQSLQYVSIDTSANKASAFNSIDGDASNVTEIYAFSSKDQNGVVFKNNSNFTYIDENKKNVSLGAALSTDSSINLVMATHHKGTIAVFFDWTSNSKKNVGYQIITKDGKIDSSNTIIQEASSVSLTKSTDGSLFALIVNGKDGNVGQIWGKSGLALKTAFAAIFAAFAAIFLF